MQKAYINSLYMLAQKDSRVISCLADSGTEYDEMFKREFPNQCFNFGIAEEHLVAAAAGLARCGKIPFVYTTGTFLAYRAFEFIRDDVCLQKNNVKIVGMGSGLAWSTLGPTHHATEDLAVLRALPNLTIFSPVSPSELTECVKEAYHINGPVYIRIGMSGEKEIYEPDYVFHPGRNVLLREGKDVIVFVTGSIAADVLDAAGMLGKRGISVKVVNIHTVQPLDREGVLQAVFGVKRVFTVEEHSIVGGIGSAVAEILAEENAGVPLTRIGLNHCFARGYGSLEEVRTANGLDTNGLFRTIVDICQR